MGGMAAAIRLAVQGFDVTVFERNDKPGGKLGWFSKDGFSFDTGPSLFTQPENLEALFALAGEPIADYFTYKKMPVSCHYFFENGRQMIASADKQTLAASFENDLNEKASAINSYLRDSELLYHNIGDFFISHSLHKAKTYFSKGIWTALKAARLRYTAKSLHQYNSSRFQSKEAVQLFNRYATYNGSNPYKAPAMLSLIPHLEMNQGTFYPDGGMIAIVDALYKLALKKGIVFNFNMNVSAIIRNNTAATGIIAGEKKVLADIIVSNVDVYFTYKNLLQHPQKAAKVLKQERSSSALIFYWGIDRQFDTLGLHNIFFSDNYQKEFDSIFNTKTVFEDPTVYINITSKQESKHAPSGCENWFVMVNVPANSGQDWVAIKQTVRRSVIAKLSRMLKTDLEPLIRTEACLDPVTIETNTASYMGSLYGTSSNSPLAAFFRHPNFSKAIKNLYFVGGSVHPGGGIPLCLKSAAIVADLVQDDFKQKWR